MPGAAIPAERRSMTVLIDEVHVGVLVPHVLPDTECRRISRTLYSKRFRAALTSAVRSVFARFPALSKVRVTLTR
jgi:hypothetical protein